MILAYVCWEYRSETDEGVEANIAAARKLAERINAIPGWRAIVPHNFSCGIERTLTEEQWLEFDIVVMKRSADVLVFDKVHSASSGCLKERREFLPMKIEQGDLEIVAAAINKGGLGKWGEA